MPGPSSASPVPPGLRLRDIATTLDITERSVLSFVTGLTPAGYFVQD
jgi:hypothetical protein